MLPISHILEKKLRLYVRKVSLLSRVFADRPHYILTYRDLNLLRMVIGKEIVLNKKLLHHIKVYAESNSNHLEPFVVKFEEITRGLILVLRQERKVLRKIGLTNLILHEADVLLLRRSRMGYFDVQFSHFKELYKKEQDLDARLFIIVSQKKEIVVAKFKVYKKIASDINIHSKALLHSIGNAAQIRKNAQEILKVLDKVKNTELYSYMRSDIVFIKDQIKEVMKDPRKSKVKTLLAAIYMFTPGTFDTTVYILLLKNLTKVTINRFGKKKFRPRAS